MFESSRSAGEPAAYTSASGLPPGEDLPVSPTEEPVGNPPSSSALYGSAAPVPRDSPAATAEHPPPTVASLPPWTPGQLRLARKSKQFILSSDEDILDNLEILQRLECFSAGISAAYTGVPQPQREFVCRAARSQASATSLPSPAIWSPTCAGLQGEGVILPLSPEDLLLTEEVEAVNASLLLR